MSNSTPEGTRTTMFYDGGCPLCSKEVAHYQRIDSGNNVVWSDITTDSELLHQHGISNDAAMKHLHVLDARGDIVRGAYAFHALWSALPRYRYLAKVSSAPGVLWVMDKLYQQFAKRRYAARMRCSQA